MFKQNGYIDKQLHCAVHPPCREDTPREEPMLVACSPFVASIFNCISRVLTRHSIKTVSLQPREVTSFLWPMKDDLGLKTAGVCSISCKCGNIYIDGTGHPIEIRIKEHH
jgi:hypothetical protein